jgi:hypothetical protein
MYLPDEVLAELGAAIFGRRTTITAITHDRNGFSYCPEEDWHKRQDGDGSGAEGHIAWFNRDTYRSGNDYTFIALSQKHTHTFERVCKTCGKKEDC